MADARDLVSLQTLKSFINPALGTTDDYLLTQMTTAVSIWIARYLGRDLVAQTYNETRNGNGRSVMRMYHWPIISIKSVQINGATLNPAPATLPLNGGGWVFDEQNVYLRPGLGFPVLFRTGFQNVLISYEAGYNTPGQIEQSESASWAPNQVVALAAGLNPGNGFSYVAQVGGETGPTMPTFPTTQGASVTDGSVTWRCTGAYVPPIAGAKQLPESLSLCAMQQISLAYRNRNRIGDTSTGIGPERVSFFMKDMHPMTKSMLDDHREVVPIGASEFPP